jgi:hypothetical protein
MEIRYWFQAAGLQFEDYRHSPIYRAHCVTANFMARCLRDRGERLNAWMPDNAASRFRMLRPHRTDGANALRRQVAAMGNLPPEANSAYLAAHAEASKALARGEIRAFSVCNDVALGRVIHYETHQGWMPDPVYSDLHDDNTQQEAVFESSAGF